MHWSPLVSLLVSLHPRPDEFTLVFHVVFLILSPFLFTLASTCPLLVCLVASLVFPPCLPACLTSQIHGAVG